MCLIAGRKVGRKCAKSVCFVYPFSVPKVCRKCLHCVPVVCRKCAESVPEKCALKSVLQCVSGWLGASSMHMPCMAANGATGICNRSHKRVLASCNFINCWHRSMQQLLLHTKG